MFRADGRTTKTPKAKTTDAPKESASNVRHVPTPVTQLTEAELRDEARKKRVLIKDGQDVARNTARLKAIEDWAKRKGFDLDLPAEVDSEQDMAADPPPAPKSEAAPLSAVTGGKAIRGGGLDPTETQLQTVEKKASDAENAAKAAESTPDSVPDPTLKAGIAALEGMHGQLHSVIADHRKTLKEMNVDGVAMAPAIEAYEKLARKWAEEAYRLLSRPRVSGRRLRELSVLRTMAAGRSGDLVNKQYRILELTNALEFNIEDYELTESSQYHMKRMFDDLVEHEYWVERMHRALWPDPLSSVRP
jgi:hypothetical protein